MTDPRDAEIVGFFSQLHQSVEYTERKVMLTGHINESTGLIDDDPQIGLADLGHIWLHSDSGRVSMVAIVGAGMRGATRTKGVPCKTGLNTSGERVAIEPLDNEQTAALVAQIHNAERQSAYVTSAQFAPGLVTAWSPEVHGDYGLNVYVNPITHGSIVITGALDVSALVPAVSGERGIVVIYYDVSADALGAVAGTPSAVAYSPDTYGPAEAAAIALGDTDRIRLGAVVLENGQTTIVETAPFIECRDWLTLEGSSGNLDVAVGATTVTGVTSLTFVGGSLAGSTPNVTYTPPGGSGGIGDLIILSDQQSSGTDGGTFTSGAWRTRVLNTEDTDAGGHCSLASNQFTLDAGTYRIRAAAPAYGVRRHKAKLYNISDSADVVIGQTADIVNADGGQTISWIIGRFTIATSKTFEIQHQCGSTRGTAGFGVAASFGVVEIYTIVEMVKES